MFPGMNDEKGWPLLPLVQENFRPRFGPWEIRCLLRVSAITSQPRLLVYGLRLTGWGLRLTGWLSQPLNRSRREII